MTAKVINEVDDFRLLEVPCDLPSIPAKHCYEIVMGHYFWIRNKMKVKWIILRVIIHEDEKYALETATNIFNNLIRPY